MVGITMIPIQTATEIIDLLGGNAAVAKLTATTAKAVSNWRSYDRFPANTYLLLKSELVRLGHSAPDHLWSMRMPPLARNNRRSA